VKLWGTARVIEDDPALIASLVSDGYKARPEQAIVFHVEAWDTNCPKHIPLRFEAETVAQELAKRESRIDALEAEIGQLRAQLAEFSRAAGS
jgi:predicted pyridoxine 5'-phosphate oxidase superfamily flavin-nucleotide-binding protein